MSKNRIIINNDQKKKSFDLIKEIIAQYVLTLEELTETQPANDLFNRTSKTLILSFTEDMRVLIQEQKEVIELSASNIDIIKETMNFYWSNGRTIFEKYTENDYINACNLLNINNKSFVK